MKFSRRALIGGTLAAGGVAAVGGYQLLGPVADPEGAIAGFIARAVPNVSADDSVVTTFATDSLGFISNRYPGDFDVHVSLLANPFLVRFLPERQAAFHSDFQRLLVTQFMRSTDLLLTEPGAPVNYIAFADPYQVGCSNPLAQLA